MSVSIHSQFPANDAGKKDQVSAREMTVIETIHNRGAGTTEDPVRKVYRYWDKSGMCLAEFDAWTQRDQTFPAARWTYTETPVNVQLKVDEKRKPRVPAPKNWTTKDVRRVHEKARRHPPRGR